jgi:uroporphyrinogen III methyltransferase/synthase
MTMAPIVILTRPSGSYERAGKLSSAIEELGFDVCHLPVLKIERLPIEARAIDVFHALSDERPAWICFLSPTAVYVTAELLRDSSLVLPRAVRIAAQGPGTGDAVEDCFDRPADFIPSVAITEPFAHELSALLAPGIPVIVPQSADGRDVFAPILRGKGVSVETVEIYRTVATMVDDDSIRAFEKTVNAEAIIVFMSPSAVNATVGALKNRLDFIQRARILSIGPITSAAVRAAGLNVWAEAREHSEGGVLDVLKGESGK